MAGYLEKLAAEWASTGDRLQAQRLYHQAAVWSKQAGDEEAMGRQLVLSAESMVAHAEDNGEGKALVDAMFCEKAIQLYRAIPKKLRDVHAAPGRSEELQGVLRQAGLRSTGGGE